MGGWAWGGRKKYSGGDAHSAGRHQAHGGGAQPSEGQTLPHKPSKPQGVSAKGFLCPGLKAVWTKSFLHFTVTRSAFLEALQEGDSLYSKLLNQCERGFLSERDQRVEILPTLSKDLTATLLV